MDDRDERDSGSSPLGARVRSALGVVREQGAASLRGVRRSAAEATDRLKSTQAAERLGAAVETRRVIKKASDAQRRGNHPMAYRLLESEVRENPDDARVVAAFWSAALACERAEDAVPALLRIIRKLASSGEPERAAELWLELREACPRRAGRSELARPHGAGPGGRRPRRSGSPWRFARPWIRATTAASPPVSPFGSPRWRSRARPADGPRARRAEPSHRPTSTRPSARASRISSPSSRRPKTDGASRRPARSPRRKTAPRRPSPPARDARRRREVTERAVDDALEALAPTARFGDIKVTEAMPTKLREEAVGLQLLAGRKVGIEYAKIEAVAVAEVGGLADHPVVVIDLVLNWSEQEDPTLRVARLRSDGFDPRMVIAAPDDRGRGLAQLSLGAPRAQRRRPAPGSGRRAGRRLRAFDDLEAYQREVLQVGA